MPSSHLILCRPLLLLPPIPPSIRVFSNESLFAWGGQSIGVSASASVLPMNTQDWSPLGWTRWISLQSKGFSLSPYICIKGNSRLLYFLIAQSSIYYQEYSFVTILTFHVKIWAKNISHIFKWPSCSCNRKDHDVLSQFHFQSPSNIYFTLFLCSISFIFKTQLHLLLAPTRILY